MTRQSASAQAKWDAKYIADMESGRTDFDEQDMEQAADYIWAQEWKCTRFGEPCDAPSNWSYRWALYVESIDENPQ